MSSKSSNDSEERIRRATEFIWKVWWFCFYLIIAPIACALLTYYITDFITIQITGQSDFHFAIAFSLLALTFSLFFFYIGFDRYRDKPFFKNIENNLVARIHISYFVTFAAVLLTPIVEFITSQWQTGKFGLFPLIAFIVIYNITWFYFYFKPVDLFDDAEKRFKHIVGITSIFTNLHNFIFIISYIIQIVFLAFISYTQLSWFYLFILNVFFYGITLLFTRNVRFRITNAIKENRKFLNELIEFKQKLVSSNIGLFFCISILLTFLHLLFSPLMPPLSSLDLFNISLIILCLIIIFLKVELYVYFHYTHHLELASEERRKKVQIRHKNRQKINFILSLTLITSIFSLLLFLDFPILAFLSLVFINILFYLEERAGFSDKKYNRILYMTNTIIILASFCFRILELNWNEQLIIFCIVLYFILEIFARIKLLDKRNISIVQDFLIISSFFLILYLFFPFIFSAYIVFTSDPFIISYSYFFINALIFLIALLSSLYRLYFSRFKRKASNFFKTCLTIISFLIEIFLFILINFRIYFLVAAVDPGFFFNSLIISSILFPLLFILFAFLNYLIGIFSKGNFLNYSYFASWFLFASIFISIISVFFNIIALLLDLLFFSITLHYLLKFGVKLGKISNSKYQNYVKFNSYIVAGELFTILFYIFFELVFVLNVSFLLISIFLSTAIICVLINIFSLKEELFSREFIIKFTSFAFIFLSFIIFYYSFLFFYGTYYVLTVPVILSCISLYLPIYYIFYKKLIHENWYKKFIAIDNIPLSVSIIILPTIIILDLLNTGLILFSIFLILIGINCTLYLIFGFLKLLEYISIRYKYKELNQRLINKSQIFVWFFISISTSVIFLSIIINEFLISISILIFFVFNIYTLKKMQKLGIISSSSLKTCYNIIFFGSTFTLSYLVMLLFHNIISLIIIFPPDLAVLNYFLYFISFFSSILVLFKVSESVFRLEFFKGKEIIELGSWLYVKIVLILLISNYLSFSIINKITFFIAIFSILSPITISYLKKARISLDKYIILIENITIFTFIGSFLVFFIEVFWNFAINFSFFNENPIILIGTLCVNIFIFLNYCFIKNYYSKRKSKFRLIELFSLNLLLFISLLYIEPLISFIFLFLLYIIIFRVRNENLILRVLNIFLLSYITFLRFYLMFHIYSGFDFSIFEPIPLGFFIIEYLVSLSCVLFFAIILNLKKHFHLEKFILYGSISAISFVFFLTFTNILLLYNITISLGIILFFYSVFLRRIGDKNYHLYKKTLIVLIIFDVISYISYQFLFILPVDDLINNILIFTFTLSITGFGFVLLFNEIPEKYRKYSFYTFLTAIVISLPTFLYFLLTYYLPISLEEPLPLIISLNLGIFLFYLSIGIYKWKISWAIWKAGWWLWNIFPIVNFVIIYRIFLDIDVYTNALTLFGTLDFNGSLIISILISSLLYLPVLYTKIKEHFGQILLFFWIESFGLVAWITFNIFGENFLLTYLSFTIISIFLLMPIIYKLKYWKVLSKLWILLSGINIVFLIFYLMFLNMLPEIITSIVLIAIGLFSMIYSYFPMIRSKITILIFSYTTFLLGMFLLIYFILNAILLNPFIAVNISFIILGFSMFSSKYLKLNKKYTHFVISIILIINFSLLTFFSFYIIPGLELFSIFFAIAIFGGTFFVFNRYEKMIFNFNKAIPWTIMAFGTSLTITSLLFPFTQESPMFICFIFSSVLILFFYPLLDKYRFVLLFFVPFPLTFLILAFLLFIPIIHTVGIITWLMVYFSFLQVIINLFSNLAKKGRIKIKNEYLEIIQKDLILRILNSVCFIINSLFISIWISVLTPISWYNQIFEFLIIWSTLLLCSLKYIELSGIKLKVKPLTKFLNGLSLFLYWILPTAILLNVWIFLIEIEVEILFSLFFISLLGSGILFLESFVVDKYLFKYLIPKIRNQIILWSWFVGCNLLSIYLYLFHLDIFLLLLTLSLLNLISTYFLSQINVKYKKTSSLLRVYLIYSILIMNSLYFASLISNLISGITVLLIGFPTTLLFLLLSVVLLFFSSLIYNKIVQIKFILQIEFILFIFIQILFTIYWITIFEIFLLLNFFNIGLLLLIESSFSFYSIYLLNQLYFKEKYLDFKAKGYSLITFCLYIELILLIYSLFESFGFLESSLISLITLFILSIFELYIVKSFRKRYGYLIHTTSYLLISIFLLIFLNRFLIDNPDLLWFNLFLFFTMQFYTNYALFSTLKQFFIMSRFYKKIETLKEKKLFIQGIIGLIFYLFLFIFIQRALGLAPIEYQIMLLSIAVHLMMIIDQYLFKFLLSKWSNSIKIMSWISIMISSIMFLDWIFTFAIAFIPLIIIFLIIEFYYLFYLLRNIKIIRTNKNKIKRSLLFLLYVNFISWPLYFASLDILFTINLIIFSSIILFVLSYLDINIRVFKEKSRLKIRRISFLFLGSLLSLNCFLYLGLLLQPYTTNWPFNLSVAMLILLIFIAIDIKPFQKHSLLALPFWIATFLSLSVIVYYFSLSYIWSTVFFVITLLLYPFIFFFEELKEQFGQIIDYVLIKFRALKMKIVNFFNSIKIAILKAYNKLVNFLKQNWKYIWGIIIIIIFIVIFILLEENIAIPPLNLAWFHALPVDLVVTFLLAYPIMRDLASEDPESSFRVKMIYYCIIYGSVVGTLFGFIPPNIFLILFSIIIFGAILLFFIYREEKRGRISIKWRFFTTLIFIILIILTAILLYLQIAGIFILI